MRLADLVIACFVVLLVFFAIPTFIEKRARERPKAPRLAEFHQRTASLRVILALALATMFGLIGLLSLAVGEWSAAAFSAVAAAAMGAWAAFNRAER
jgi:hypothetical protein